MQREIKFRVWCKQIKHFTDSPFYSCAGGQLLWLHTGNNVSISNLDEGDYIIQQYSGINDVNGKEIYEGDIIETMVSMSDNKPDRFVVTFKDGAFRCGDVPYITLFDEMEDGMPSYGQRVVGNILENPKLLK